MLKWEQKHDRAAARQGWGIFHSEFLGREVANIERIDAPEARDGPRFPDDVTAKAYVVGRAEAGCKLARRALRFVKPYGGACKQITRVSDWRTLVA